ncbi:hypothetical protein TcCL_NonESM12608 [Trypanosoma cruzi]|nr:hypothetical protein TcCL_NonESM12608 [Trypanosoma cruzi]
MRRRLDSIHFVSAFMHADDRTLVFLDAYILACGAAMQAAVSPVATWTAEHSLRINADRSGAALFCIASHRQSDEDTADHRLGGGKPRVKFHPVCLLGNAIDRLLIFGLHVTVAAGQTVPRCRQLRLDAEAGAFQHTMRSLPVGCVHSALHHGGKAIAPCPALIHLHSLEVRHGDSCTPSLDPRVSAKDTYVHLAVNPAPLRRIVGFRAPTQHERLTLLRYIEDVRGVICAETTPSSILGKAATTIPLPGDAVLKELRRVRRHMEISPDHIRAPHAEQRIVTWTLWAAAGWASSGHGTPRTPWTVSDDRPLKRPAPLWDHMTQAAGRTARCLSLRMPLDQLRCHLTPRTTELPVGPHRAAAGRLACSCRAERPATERGHRQFPVPRLAAASQSPTRVPVATNSLSAIEALRLGPLAVHDCVSEEICTVPHSLAD